MGEDQEKAIIGHPTEVLVSVFPEVGGAGFKYGRLAMALEIETLIRLLDTTEVSSALIATKEEVISVLKTFLGGQGFADVSETYDGLLRARRIVFVADDEPASEP
jgi:photosystem II stability/assembly factor-like uncharacterized protein